MYLGDKVEPPWGRHLKQRLSFGQVFFYVCCPNFFRTIVAGRTLRLAGLHHLNQHDPSQTVGCRATQDGFGGSIVLGKGHAIAFFNKPIFS